MTRHGQLLKGRLREVDHYPMRRTAVALTLGLTLAACGGGDETAQSTTTVPTTLPPATVASSVPEQQPPSTSDNSNELSSALADDGATDTTQAPTTETTVEETTTEAPTTAPPELALDGTRFVSDDGGFSIVIPADWDDDVLGIPDSVDAWYVGGIEDGFAPNVNILSLPSGGLDVEAYTQLGIDSLTSPGQDYTILDFTTVQAPAGHTMTRLEMENSDLKFLQYAFVDGANAVTLTLTSPKASFDQHVAELNPYLLSLQPN